MWALNKPFYLGKMDYKDHFNSVFWFLGQIAFFCNKRTVGVKHTVPLKESIYEKISINSLDKGVNVLIITNIYLKHLYFFL